MDDTAFRVSLDGQAGEQKILLIEDNALIAYELMEFLGNAGFAPVGPLARYDAALEAAARAEWDSFCVLDLDLGERLESSFAPGEEGRRLLSLLQSRGVRTVIYSAFSTLQPWISELHDCAEVVDKTRGPHAVIEALQRLRSVRRAPQSD